MNLKRQKLFCFKFYTEYSKNQMIVARGLNNGISMYKTVYLQNKHKYLYPTIVLFLPLALISSNLLNTSSHPFLYAFL